MPEKVDLRVAVLQYFLRSQRKLHNPAIVEIKKQTGGALTVSIGVASLPGDAGTAEELVDRADRALYIAKSMGKNCVKPFSDERREYTRLDATLAGHFSVLEKDSHVLTTLNLSEGGVLFHCRQRLPTGAFVKVQLALSPSGEPVEGAVRVLRAVGARDGFEIGAEIIHMPRAHQRRFRFFLKQLKAAAT